MERGFGMNNIYHPRWVPKVIARHKCVYLVYQNLNMCHLQNMQCCLKYFEQCTFR